jgi:predicted PurR-regulated permease PerM
MTNRDPQSVTEVHVQPRRAPNWERWRDIPLAILAWIALVIVILWLASHITEAILVLAIAALLAYALAPLVKFLERLMPRALAIGVVYLAVLGGLGSLLYFAFSTAFQQFLALADQLRDLNHSQLGQTLHRIGLTDQQLGQIGQQVIGQIQGIATGIFPILLSTVTVGLDIIVLTVLSIYLLIDGMRVNTWLRQHTPLAQRDRVWFILDTLERVVGGYIRGQVTLALLIGALVGVGMQIIGVPYAVLLGVMAFVLEFIPFIGTLTSGAVCVLLALSLGPVRALVVLAYFVGVHIIEGDLVGPRIVGKAVGLHPAVSLFALLAGAELFGVWGAIFAAPLAGVTQALLTAFYADWRAAHPEQFPKIAHEAPDAAAGPEGTSVTVVTPVAPGNGHDAHPPTITTTAPPEDSPTPTGAR